MEELKREAIDEEGLIEEPEDEMVIKEEEVDDDCECCRIGDKECRHGTFEDFKKDMEQCGFHSTADEVEIPLESALAKTRIAIDNAMQKILVESQLPIFLFDYLVTSVLCDIRKADLDTLRSGPALMTQPNKEN